MHIVSSIGSRHLSIWRLTSPISLVFELGYPCWKMLNFLIELFTFFFSVRNLYWLDLYASVVSRRNYVTTQVVQDPTEGRKLYAEVINWPYELPKCKGRNCSCIRIFIQLFSLIMFIFEFLITIW